MVKGTDLKAPLFVIPTAVLVMCHACRTILTLVAAIVSMPASAFAQDNPYRVEEGWAKYPEGREMGSMSCALRVARRLNHGSNAFL